MCGVADSALTPKGTMRLAERYIHPQWETMGARLREG